MAEESKLENTVKNYARESGVLTYKFVSPAHRGVPDRLFVFPGGFVLFIEFKAKGKVPTPLQARYLKLLREQGALVAWIDSLQAGLDIIDGLLEKTSGRSVVKELANADVEARRQ